MNCFVLDLSYLADVREIDALMPAHRAFLAPHYADGTFLLSGRKEPRTGGLILARGARDRIEAIVAQDPFTVAGVAAYTVTEFVPTTAGDELAFLTV
ncbi:YciI family protein [Cellulomonas taurus]|uniref:YciI family protein n=1 Tax=Cellulomonas taurus TaxID=2729175 RepID=UPI00145F1974|nr:YciI family protein [Cellulomonas taurus]